MAILPRWGAFALLGLSASCIAGPDYTPQSDRAALEAAYRSQSAAARAERNRRRAETIKKLDISAGESASGFLLTADLQNAPREFVMSQIFAHPEIEFQTNAYRATGEITARFSGVDLVQGLNIILENTGVRARLEACRVVLEPSSIMVSSAESTDSSQTISREIALTHLVAADAVQLLGTLYQKEGDFEASKFTVESIEELNTLFVSGPAELVAQAMRVVAQADRPVPHIIMEALVVNIDTSTVESIGLSLADGADGNFSALSIIPNDLGGNIVTTFSELASNSAELTATIEFLAARNAAQVIARPYLAARSTKTASINIVNDQFARVDTSGDDSSIITTDSITAGVTMEITPLVTGEDTVRLDVSIEESRFGATAGDIVISKERNAASTSMAVKSGQTIVIGGLNRKYRISQNSGIPWLRNIPVFNVFSSSRGSVETRKQLVVYLTPYIWYPGQDLPLPFANRPRPIAPTGTSMEQGGRRPR